MRLTTKARRNKLRWQARRVLIEHERANRPVSFFDALREQAVANARDEFQPLDKKERGLALVPAQVGIVDSEGRLAR